MSYFIFRGYAVTRTYNEVRTVYSTGTKEIAIKQGGSPFSSFSSSRCR